MVERSLSMREVRGSMPLSSNFSHYSHSILFQTNNPIRILTPLIVSQILSKVLQCFCLFDVSQFSLALGEFIEAVRPLRILRGATSQSRRSLTNRSADAPEPDAVPPHPTICRLPATAARVLVARRQALQTEAEW